MNKTGLYLYSKLFGFWVKFIAGKVFLYVYRESYFEVVFKTDCFMHLTGVSLKRQRKNYHVFGNCHHWQKNFFCKDASHEKYSTLTFSDESKDIPYVIERFLSSELLEWLKKDKSEITT